MGSFTTGLGLTVMATLKLRGLVNHVIRCALDGNVCRDSVILIKYR